MRAITYERFGPATEVLKIEKLPTPDPQDGEVLVRLHASGVNPSDIRARAGGRPGVTKPPFPKIIPHSDGAGVIEAVGKGVDASRIGQRVWIWNGQWRRPFGTAAEYMAVPDVQAVSLPDHIPFATGAVLGIPGLTACHTVLGNGPVAGKTVLISGGAGTVGHLAVQVAAKSGAKVISTARGETGLAAARMAGAHTVLDYSDANLAERILDANDGQGVDQIVEVEFGQNVETNTAVISEGGNIVTYGSARNMTPTLPFYPLMFKAVTIETVLVYLLSAEQRAIAIQNLMSLLERNALDIRISRVFKLEQCADAHNAIDSGDRAGSIILEI